MVSDMPWQTLDLIGIRKSPAGRRKEMHPKIAFALTILLTGTTSAVNPDFVGAKSAKCGTPDGARKK
jgi:hypothetical protein